MAASDPVVSHPKVVMGSNYMFGLVFAAVFALIGLFPAIHGAPIRMWALAVAAAFVAAALLVRRLLYPLNRAWFALGLLLHHIVNPIVMAVLFYGAILPMALRLRLLAVRA